VRELAPAFGCLKAAASRRTPQALVLSSFGVARSEAMRVSVKVARHVAP